MVVLWFGQIAPEGTMRLSDHYSFAVAQRAALVAGVQCAAMSAVSVVFLLSGDYAQMFLDAFGDLAQLLPSLARYEAYYSSRDQPDEAARMIAIFASNIAFQVVFIGVFIAMARRIVPGWRDRPVTREISWGEIWFVLSFLVGALVANLDLVFGPLAINQAAHHPNRGIVAEVLWDYLGYCWLLPLLNFSIFHIWYSMNTGIYGEPRHEPPISLDVRDAFTPAQHPPAGRRADGGET
jgi:hypothetical protein